MNKVLSIEADGSLTALYDDDLPRVGPRQIVRASTVEPDEHGLWTVQLSDDPLNKQFAGEYLYNEWATDKDKIHAKKFERREEALAAEVAFINTYIL